MDALAIAELLEHPLNAADAAAIAAGLQSGAIDYAWLVAVAAAGPCETVRARLERLAVVTQAARVSCETATLQKSYDCLAAVVDEFCELYSGVVPFQELSAFFVTSPADVVAAAQTLVGLLGGLGRRAVLALSNATDPAVAVALSALYPDARTSPDLAEGTAFGQLCRFAVQAAPPRRPRRVAAAAA